MATFSKSSLEKLKTCHMDLQTIFNEIIKYFDCTISEGYRDEIAQNKAYANGKSKLKFPHGNHNKSPSMAVDVYPYPIDLNPNTQRESEIYKYRMSYFAGIVMQCAKQLKIENKISHDLRWGCDWDGDTEIKDHAFLDFPHFELIT
jgi:peptidoglycan L-alanyl-D-glutamate endopeptidase CwlK